MSLAGRIDTYFFDELSTGGIGLLELAGNAHAMFEKEDPLEKRRLLNFFRTARGAAESFAPPSADHLIHLQKRPPSRRSPIQFTDKIHRDIRVGWPSWTRFEPIFHCSNIASSGCWITLT